MSLMCIIYNIILDFYISMRGSIKNTFLSNLNGPRKSCTLLEIQVLARFVEVLLLCIAYVGFLLT